MEILILFLFIFFFLLFLFTMYAMWRCYTKVGIAGWKAIIPIMNIVALFPLANLSTWMLLLIFIPIVNIYIVYQVYAALADRLQEKRIFALGLLLLPMIFFPILAFKKEAKKVQEEPISLEEESGVESPIAPLEARPDLDEIYAMSKEMVEGKLPLSEEIAQNLEPQKMEQPTSYETLKSPVGVIEKMQYVEEEKEPLNLEEYKMCPQCGTKLDVHATTCFLCGTVLEQE